MRRPPALAKRSAPRSRRSTTRYQALYGSQAWRRASERFRASPEGVLCVDCLARGKLLPSEVTDHIRPHDGNLALFWDPANWAARCWSCHSSKSMDDPIEARTGRRPLRRGCAADGAPLDPSHFWNR